MNAHVQPMMLRHTLRTPGVYVLAAIVALGVATALYRFLVGLGPTTNLSDAYPWGIWKAINVAASVALGAGGFTMAALVYIFNRRDFHAIARPALLTALLGYTFAVLALAVDLGRYYSMWHLLVPSMWQGNSVLFEVGMCVVCYLTVLYIEFVPAVCERLERLPDRPKLSQSCKTLRSFVEQTMFLFIIAGVTMSCLHQSALGTLMVIAADKVHPLWQTPVLPLLFLLSACVAGFAVVIFAMLVLAWGVERRPDMALLSSLARYLPILGSVYVAAKLTDMVIRESYLYLWESTALGVVFIIEIVPLLALPVGLLLFTSIRRSPLGLSICTFLIASGVVLNRMNVFVTGFRPAYEAELYVPSIAEVVVAVGFVAAIVLGFRVLATYLPIVSDRQASRGA